MSIGLPKGMNRNDAYVQGMADAQTSNAKLAVELHQIEAEIDSMLHDNSLRDWASTIVERLEAIAVQLEQTS